MKRVGNGPEKKGKRPSRTGKVPIAQAASGVGLLLKLLGNGTLYVSMNPARGSTPYKASCDAALP